MNRSVAALCVTLFSLSFVVTGCGGGGNTSRPDAVEDFDSGRFPDVHDGTAINIDATDTRVTPDVVADVGTDAPCDDAFAMCGSTCADLQTDATHCGSCTRNCRLLPNVVAGAARCVAGVCDVTAACQPGHAHCSANPTDGCEAMLGSPTRCGTCTETCADPRPMCAMQSGVDGGAPGFACSSGCTAMTPDRCGGTCVDLQTSVTNCGACATNCATAPNATATCAAGTCGYACLSGFADCDGLRANGCEVDMRTDVRNCSMCGRVCRGGVNGTAACRSGVCGLICVSGFSDCDSDLVNGCEIDTRVSAQNCVTCGTACSDAPNAVGVCTGTACGITCLADFANCDGNTANGCETNIRSNLTACGVCGRMCTSGQVCGNGLCTTACPAGQTNCSGACVDTQSAATNCSACGVVCTAPANATASCTTGVCGFRCNAGFADCDGSPTNGCETPTSADPVNCGACGTMCSGALNARPACSAGVCRLRCNVGYDNCDGNVANGCEVNTTTSSVSCGTCGTSCPSAAQAAGVCTTGSCGLVCDPGFGDCNGTTVDGCETNTLSSRTHCGNCATLCAVGQVCANGACVTACPAGQTLCSGSCVDVQTTAAHCGMCGHTCASGANASATCTAGRCTLRCDPNYSDCDGAAMNGCETNIGTDSTNCGVCAQHCSGGTNGTGACVARICGLVCSTGTADCDGDVGTGCEANITSSPLNCGTCGTVCNAAANGSAACIMGTCRITCDIGFANCNGTTADGCEADTRTDTRNCGGCAIACPSGQVCAGGVCQISCAAGQTNCSGTCANLTTSPANCGGCGSACPPRANSAPTCTSSTCGFRCNAGFSDCNSSASDGCEANNQTDPSNCGTCAVSCTGAPQGIPTCAGGTCSYVCGSGFGDCDGVRANGCETNLQTSPLRCGTCATTCPSFDNSSPVCRIGVCTIACNVGFSNCDGITANGCETHASACP